MSPATKRRKNLESLEGCAKRLRIQEPSRHDGEILSEHSEDEPSSEDDSYNLLGGTYTPSTSLSITSTPNYPPCRQKTLKCTYENCQKTFNRPTRLASHLRSHTNTRPFTCPYEDCIKSYIEEKHLNQHIKGSHTHERSHHCDWEGCSKSFLTATRLRRHKAAHEGHERFRCTDHPPCMQTFRKHQTLQRHIRAEHMHLAPFPCTLIDEDTGKQCEAGFDGSNGLRKHHERVHGGSKFYCGQCPEVDNKPIGFSTDSQLQKHMKKEHAACMFCENKFCSQRDLQKHIESQHSGISLQERKTVLCPQVGCTKTFVKKSNLNVHIRTAHNGERYICGNVDVSGAPDLEAWNSNDACGRDFYSKANLEDHIRTAHLGLCTAINSKARKAAAPRRKSLKPTILDELIGEIPTNPKRTLPCNFHACDAMFIRAYDLEVHLRTKHHSPPFSLQTSPQSFRSSLDYRDPTDARSEEADIEWELQQRVLNGDAFWIGAEEGTSDTAWQGGDQWLGDEWEMRALVDDADDDVLKARIDPMLESL